MTTAAETLRANPAFDSATAITELGVGEALVSFLDKKGRPNVVERAFVLPPASRIGPLTGEERQAAIKSSLVYGVYEQRLDRESAFENLKAGKPAQPEASPGGLLGGLGDLFGGGANGRPGGRAGRESRAESWAKSAARAIGSQLGREIIRGVLGSVLGGSRRR